MRCRPIALLTLLVLAPLASRDARAQDNIATIKTAPQDYRGRQIRLEGEVIELRALSPRSTRGIYRLVDESDQRGLLIRSDDLPETGGPFRIRARLSPELLLDGTLLLEELERDRARSPMLFVAGLIGGGGLVMALAALGLFVRARREERHLHLGPPMWLIPTGKDQPGEVPEAQGPEVRFNYRLQYIEEERSSQLERRKRQLLGALAVAGGIGAAGSGWFTVLQRDDAARPSFVLLTANGGTATGPAGPSETRPDDTLRLGIVPPAESVATRPERVALAPPPPPPAAASPTQTPRTAVVRPADTARRQQAVPSPAPARDTARPVAADSPPPVVTPPPPAPPPPPPAEEPRSAPPPAPDPEVLRRGAATELGSGLQRLIGAINGRQMGVAAGLYSPAPAEARRRERFLDFVREFSPKVTVQRSDPPTLTETSAEAAVTLLFEWRGDFGVDRRKAVRWSTLARREGDRWVFAGARLLENLP